MIVSQNHYLNQILDVHPLNRPGIANTSVISSFIHWLRHWPDWSFIKCLQNTFNPKPSELESWHFERRFTCPYLSSVSCHMSRVTCYMAHVSFHLSHVFFFLFTKCQSSFVKGLLSTGPTPSSIIWFMNKLTKVSVGGDKPFFLHLWNKHDSF